ncbi:MAG: DUF3570 domain-containing protein [Bdellovibrionales bacterium]|nr:DUF3570 domain-containing protein [Bdellovibrionales bacterium]
MVVIKRKSLKKSLQTAVIGLLGVHAMAEEVKIEDKPIEVKAEKSWYFDSSILYYSEPDRVTAIEPVLAVKKKISEDESYNFKLVIDSLTGASHNGATPSNVTQTFTRPSGSGTYTAAAEETPLDDTFHDTRVAISSSYQRPIDRLTRNTYGVNVSSEYDYLSLALNYMFEKDMNQKNTTLTAGVSFAHDTIKPEGGIPIPLASMEIPSATQPKDGSDDTKQTIDLILGATQIIDKESLFQLNYSFSQSDGYMTDPFKILSIVNATTGSTTDYIYEKRPDSRTKHGLYGAYKKAVGKDAVEVSYRFMTDDWGINSHTLDFHYKWLFNKGKSFLEPHIRLYTQSKADFYNTFLTQGESETYASADYRLADMNAITVGVKFGQDLKHDQSYSVRLEYYLQTGDSSRDEIGIQEGLDLYPDVDALILQVSYSF